MAEHAHYSRTVLAEAAGGRTLPSWEVTRAFVLACGGDEHEWLRRWTETERALVNGSDETPQPTQPPAAEQRRRPPRRLLLAAGAVALMGISALLGELVSARLTSTAHSVFLGEVDLAGYCRAQGYSGVSLDGTTAADWHCTRAPNTKDSLSVIEACRWQYRRGQALARYADADNPDSWQCWDNVVVLGRVDLNKYCLSRGSFAARWDATGGWNCRGADRKVVINVDSACRWQFGTQVLVAGPAPFHAPWEQWDCWG